MLNRFNRLLSRFFNKSGTINSEPLNKVSLVVIIVIDIFILVNVFVGLQDISQWYLSPYQAYPCYDGWQSYRTDTTPDKDYNKLRETLSRDLNADTNYQEFYAQGGIDHLGKVSDICLDYGRIKDQVNLANNQKIVAEIETRQQSIDILQATNQKIRDQYDSTLLEKIAGQNPEDSINLVEAAKAKQQLDQNSQKIIKIKQEIDSLKQTLMAKPESTEFLAFLKNSDRFSQLEKGYDSASFWYPSIQLAFQGLFLLPLIFVTLWIHRWAQNKNYGLMALMSWHLLVIFFVPLVIKTFEFLQVGFLFETVLQIITVLFGGLLFLVSYVYILVIPLLGFGLIRFFQRFVFNPKVQAAGRVQKSRCIQCAKRIQVNDSYCPHCGYYQYMECTNCQNLTYKYLPYCKHCGQSQDLSRLISQS
jgi:predicted RNA-binding Zn-ribbon protein involved in translation (DUF1610 family)